MAADLVIKGGWVVTPEATFKGGVAISNEVIVAIGDDASLPEGKEVIDVQRQTHFCLACSTAMFTSVNLA